MSTSSTSASSKSICCSIGQCDHCTCDCSCECHKQPKVKKSTALPGYVSGLDGIKRKEKKTPEKPAVITITEE